MGSVDLPDQPDGPDRTRHVRDSTAGAPRIRELPDPDERARAYEAMRAYVSAETAEEASPGLQPGEGAQRSGRDQASQLLEPQADQDKRLVGEWQAGRSAEFDHRGGDLRPAHGRDAEIPAAIGRARETEPTISSDVRAVEQENRYGGWLEGFDRRLKDEDRLQEKVAAKLRFQPDREAVKIIEEIPDAIRYTFCLRLETYTAGYYDIMRRLEDRGYEMYYSKNWWTNPEYKGINTRWVTPEGQRFEVQFHTPESFHTKQNVTHPAYERIRSRLVADEERTGLKAFQREAASRIQVPVGASDVSDYKKKGF